MPAAPRPSSPSAPGAPGTDPSTPTSTAGATRFENFFAKLKEFKRIAMRSCKTDTSFAAMIHAAATILNSR